MGAGRHKQIADYTRRFLQGKQLGRGFDSPRLQLLGTKIPRKTSSKGVLDVVVGKRSLLAPLSFIAESFRYKSGEALVS